MKKYEKYIEWAGTFILLLIPCFCFADDPTTQDLISSMSGSMSSWSNVTFTPPATDISVGYLAKIFGIVPGITQFFSAGQTILGTIFYSFNLGVLGISGVFLGYTTFKLITEMTTDGTSMAKGATMFTTVRVAGAAALLMPDATTGYSMINSLVMWIVIQSIGLADATWGAALDYLKKGAPLTAPTQSSWVDYSLIDPSVPSGNSASDSTVSTYNSGSADVLRALICSHNVQNALNKALAAQNAQNSAYSTSLKSSDFSLYNNTPAVAQVNSSGAVTGYTGGYYQFPYVSNESASGINIAPFNGSAYNLNIPVGNGPITGVCGTISYVTPPASLPDYSTNAPIYTPIKASALQNMIDILDPVAQKIAASAQPSADPNAPQLDASKYVVKQGDNTTTPSIYFSSVSGDDYTNAALYLPSNLQYTKFYTGCESVTADKCEQKDPVTPNNSVTGVNWPMGAAEMLSAAAAYQVAVSVGQQTAAKSIDANVAKIYQDAKNKGWIMAGSYYTLLQQAKAIQTTTNYSYSRLIGYKGVPSLSTIIVDGDRGTAPACDPFLPSTSNIGPLLATLGIAAGTGQNLDVLNRGLSWVYFAYPYAKLYGTTLTEASYTAQEKLRKPASPFLKFAMWTTNKDGIYTNLIVGGILASNVFTAVTGVPLLIAIPLEFLWYDMSQVISTLNDRMDPTSENYVSDPIVRLQLVGQQMIISGMSYLDQIQAFYLATSIPYMLVSGAMATLTAIIGAGSFWGATTGATIGLQTLIQVGGVINELVRTAINMYLPIGLAIVIPLLVTGMTLAIYVPLIPYLLFLFGAISWFISVIVLMAAAPIICFLMIWGAASQDNPLLSRESEDFIKQLLSVFFKPILMIVGLVVGVVLTRVGVDILNLGFQVVVSTVFSNTSTNQNVIMFQEIGTVIIYTFTMVSLVNICFSSIHLLHSEVITIVGMRVVAGAGIEEKALGEVKAGGQEFAQAGASGAKETGQTFGRLGSGYKPEDRFAKRVPKKTPEEPTAKGSDGAK